MSRRHGDRAKDESMTGTLYIHGDMARVTTRGHEHTFNIANRRKAQLVRIANYWVGNDVAYMRAFIYNGGKIGLTIGYSGVSRKVTP